VVILIALLGASWKWWWLCFPSFAFIGNNLNVGYRVLPEEIGLIISCSVVGLLILLNKLPVMRKDKKLNLTFIVLILYIVLHMAVSLFIGQSGLLEGGGSNIRVYSVSIIWLVFSGLLYRYCSSRNIKIIFTVSLFVLLVRNIISASQFFLFSDKVTATEVTFVLPLLEDLRVSALLSIFVSIVVFYSFRSRIVRTTLIIYLAALIYLVMLGQGRASTAIAIMIVVAWMLLTKKLKIIAPFILILLLLVITLYSNRSILVYLPIQAQRAISFIPVKDDLDIQATRGLSGSDTWHKDLQMMGFNKWTNSIGNLVFGNIIDSTDSKVFLFLPYNRMLEVAANTARYENTLWTVLATLGLVGFGLYVKLFWLLLRDIIPVVIKKGINNYYSAVYGVAFISVLLMVIFILIRGSFPGPELLFCVMAKMLYDDTKTTKTRTTSQSPC
jgi:hypothetical protein